MKNVIEISHLSKRFGEIEAVRDISFCVREGELFAFLGVNGAGKSTTISILCGQLARDEGTVLIDGLNINEHMMQSKEKLGVVFQSSGLDPLLSVRDNLESRAALYGIVGRQFQERLSELADLLDFKDLCGRRLGRLSGGQKRRIDIARALLNRPKILILDEPTTGLDPQTRRTVWNVIAHLRTEEKLTVFLTTHYMEEAADADYVVILDGGKIVAKGTPLELKNEHTGDFITLYGVDENTVSDLGYPYEMRRDGCRLAVPSTVIATDLIVKNPSLFCDYEITKGKMDDVFLAVTGKRLGDVEEQNLSQKGGSV